jgi:tetratricopeptide (TPR) repeat protein
MTENAYDEDVTTDLLACASAIAEYTDGDEYADLTELIVTQQAQRGELDAAIQRAETIPDPYLKDRALGAIAIQALEHGESQLALELINSVEDPMLQETYIEQIASKAAGEGRFDEAIQLTDNLGDPSPVLSNIASVYAAKGHLPEALELARSIETVGIRVNTLNHLAATLAKSENREEALQLVHEGENEIDDVEFPEDQIHVLVGMASVYGLLDEKGNGFDKLNEAYKISRTLEGSDPTSILAKDEALTEIVGGFGELKFFEKADQILEEVDGPFQFAQAGIRLAHGYFRDGKETEAEALLAQAVEICKEETAFTEQGVRLQNRLFSELAAAYAIHKRFDRAIEVLKLISVNEDKRAIIEMVGVLAARADDWETVTSVAELQEDSAAKGSYWVQMADAFAESEQSEAVAKSLANALQSSESIELEYDRVLIVGEVAARNAERSAELFTDAITSTPAVESYYRQARVLLSLAPKFSKAGRTPNDAEQEALKKIIVALE